MNPNVLTLAALMLMPLPALPAADTPKPSKPNAIMIFIWMASAIIEILGNRVSFQTLF